MSATVNEKMTAIADAIRAKTGGTEKLSLDGMPAAIESIETGGGDDLWQYVNSLQYTFQDATFPNDYELVLNMPNFSGGFSYAFYKGKNLKKITVKGNTAQNPVSCAYGLTNEWLEEADFTEFSGGVVKFSSFKGFGYGCPKLKYIRGILDPSAVTANYDVPFNSATRLEEVRFAQGSLKKDFKLSECPALSTDTLQSIIDGLADLTGQTACTLTLHKTAGAKLTDAQKAAAAAKNWTLAY